MLSNRDILRPIVGLFLIQPIVIIWLIYTSENPLEDYIKVGWGLQILITLWLMPVYYYYEQIYDKISLVDLKKSK